jgi:hypothetical protein
LISFVLGLNERICYVSFIWVRIADNNMYVLTRGNSKEHPDLKQIVNNNLKSLKDDKLAKSTAEKLYKEIFEEEYPHKNIEKEKDTTYKVLKKFIDKIILK